MHAIRRPIASILIGVATATVVVTAAVLPFLTPQWVAFEQGRANAVAWTGYTTEELRTATDAILSDLVIGPPDFDVEVGGSPVLVERERGHMRDVRTVFIGPLDPRGGVARHPPRRRAGAWNDAAVWVAVRRGALVLAGAVALIGVVALVAFEALFELFHRLAVPRRFVHLRPGDGAARPALPVSCSGRRPRSSSAS